MIIPAFLQTLAGTIGGTNIAAGAEAALITQATGSLTKAGAANRVEPRLLIDNSVRNYEFLDDICKFHLFDFSAYYLNAANALSTAVGGINIDALVGQLNPNRNIDMLSYDQGKSIADQPNVIYPSNKMKYALPITRNQVASFESKSATEEITAGSLAMGRVIRISFTINGEKVERDIAIRLRPSFVDPYVMSAILALEDVQDSSLRGRIDKLEAGEIDWVDFWTCRDINNKKRKLAIKDTEGVYKEITKGRQKSTIMALITGKRGYAYQSHLMIIDKATLRDAELKLHGSFKNPHVRNTAFNNSALMTIAIVDREYDHVTFWHSGYDTPIELTAKQLKIKGSSEGDAIKDMLSAFINNRAPSSF